MPIKRGEVYVADLSGSIGSEQTGTRPVVIIQNNIGNQHSPTVIVACITTKAKKTGMPTHIIVRMSEGSLSRRSMIMAEQLRTIDRKRLRDRIGTVDDLIIRRRSDMDIAVFTYAVRQYTRQRKKDIPLLMSYAETMHIEKQTREIMEVLL